MTDFIILFFLIAIPLYLLSVLNKVDTPPKKELHLDPDDLVPTIKKEEPAPSFSPPKKVGYIYEVPKEYYDAYRLYLKSPTWSQLRKTVLRRDSYKCTRCPSTDTLQIHHTYYNGIDTMTFSPTQLETVCRECHTAVHKGILPMSKV